MEFEVPGDDDECRQRVRAWLAEHPQPSARQLAEAGYVVPHWPSPYGLGADPIEQLLIDDELTKAGVRRPDNPIGIGCAGPTLLYAGTPEQQRRYLWPLLTGEEYWCQLFSEPGAGSDLAALGTRAERDGDEFVVNGQKIWTSGAQFAAFGTGDVQRNIIAERVLGLPHDVERGMSWAEARRAGGTSAATG